MEANIVLIALILSSAFGAPVRMTTTRSPNGKHEISLIRTTNPSGKLVQEIALKRVATGQLLDTIEILDNKNAPESITALWCPNSSYVAFNGSNTPFVVYAVSDERGFDPLRPTHSLETDQLYKTIQARLPAGEMGCPQVERWIDASTISVINNLARMRCRYVIREREITIVNAEPIPDK